MSQYTWNAGLRKEDIWINLIDVKRGESLLPHNLHARQL